MIDDEVEKAKNNTEWRREYMTLFMRDKENVEKGIQIGREQGLEQGLEQGVEALVNTCRLLGGTREITAQRIMEEFDFSEMETQTVLDKYWKL